MHIASRDGYAYNEHGIGFQRGSKPHINPKHIDGPLLCARDGRLHWLTMWERLRLWLGVETAESLEAKHWPALSNPSALSSAAVEVLGQLYVSGPTWDGNVASKNGRGELVRAGLAWHQHGYASLTPAGVNIAASWSRSDLRRRNSDRWLQKQRDS
ncbi:hypothetical protein [Bradyrhizobium sp. USDA 4452]